MLEGNTSRFNIAATHVIEKNIYCRSRRNGILFGAQMEAIGLRGKFSSIDISVTSRHPARKWRSAIE